MNKYNAKLIVDKVTNDDLTQIFINARKKMNNWHNVSIINKSFTKACVWNIFAKDFNPAAEYTFLAKLNMIREFGEFLPDKFEIKFSYFIECTANKFSPQILILSSII